MFITYKNKENTFLKMNLSMVFDFELSVDENNWYNIEFLGLRYPISGDGSFIGQTSMTKIGEWSFKTEIERNSVYESIKKKYFIEI